MDGMLEQIPQVMKQAHEIIGGRQVKNEEKILSAYEPEIDVIVRGKASLFMRERRGISVGLETVWGAGPAN